MEYPIQFRIRHVGRPKLFERANIDALVDGASFALRAALNGEEGECQSITR
jgi:hypothetical protein